MQYKLQYRLKSGKRYFDLAGKTDSLSKARKSLSDAKKVKAWNNRVFRIKSL